MIFQMIMVFIKIKKITKKDSKVRLIRHKSNKGFAESLKKGFINSKKLYQFCTR